MRRTETVQHLPQRTAGRLQTVAVFFLAILTLAAFPAAAQDSCNTSWKSAADGEWKEPSNWSNGLPDADDTACIEVAGSYTVSIGPFSVARSNRLIVGDGSSAITFRADALTDFGGGGILVRSGATLLADGVAVNLKEVGLLRVENGASLHLRDGGSVRNLPADGARVEVSGSLTVSLLNKTTARARMDEPFVDLLEGTVIVQSGELYMGQASYFKDATLEAETEGKLVVEGGRTNEPWLIEGTLTGRGAGVLAIGHSRVIAGSGGARLDFEGNGLQFAEGRGGSPRIEFTGGGGDFINVGHVEGRLPVELTEGGRLINQSTMGLSSFLSLSTGGELVNETGGILTLSASHKISPGDGNGGVLRNEGLIRTTGTSVTFRNQLSSQPGSEIRVEEGTLILTDEDPEHFGAGVLMSGVGKVTLGATSEIQGTLSPGSPGDEIGTFEIDRLLMAEDLGNPRLVIDVGPDGSGDRVAADRQVRLGGTLVVRLAPGFAPSIGDSWVIATDDFANDVEGTFRKIEVEGDAAGVSFAVDSSESGTVRLRAVGGGVSVSASQQQIPEGQPTAFVISHPASGDPFSIEVELSGSASPFQDYTIGAQSGVVRARANTTQTLVPVFPRNDAESDEGTETVTLRILDGANTEATISILDGPASDALAIGGISPAQGENAGTLTATILGQGMDDQSVVRLVGGTSVTASMVESATSGGVSAVFDLAGAPVGSYDVVVEAQGGSVTLAGGFEVVEASRVARVWADVSGTARPRNGRWTTYTVHMGNDTPADVYDVMLLLRITNGAEFEFLEGIRDLDIPAAEQQLALPGEDAVQVIPLWFRKLSAQSTGSFRVRLKPSGDIGLGDGMGVAYELYPPDNENPFTWSGDFEQAIPFNYGLLIGAFGAYFKAYPPAANASPQARIGNAVRSIGAERDNHCPPPSDRKPPPLIQDQDPDDFLREFDTGRRFVKYHGGIAEPSTSTAVSEYASYSAGQVLSNATKSAGYSAAGNAAGGVVAAYQIRAYGKKAQQIMNDRRNDGSLPGGDPSTGPGTGGACGNVGGSRDPNDKLGPAGVTELNYYDPDLVATPYVVRFENVDTATFPAQEVIIVDTLDTSVFDLSTFSLGPMRWGRDQVVTPPPGAQAFETTVDLRPELNATLLITAVLDVSNARAVWHFATLDPQSGLLPEDGLIGFLPPNTDSPNGEGSVTFNIRTRESLPTGTTVENRAEIIFDVNEPILTPSWVNTVDRTPPTSNVMPLESTLTNPLVIQVAETDQGSGTSLIGLFASRDGGAFELVATSDTGFFEFEAAEGSQYSFYSISVDAVGNVEGEKSDAEASTMIVVSKEDRPDLPDALTFDAPYPNPVSGQATMRYGLPVPSQARMRVVDVLGRQVAVVFDEDVTAGWHKYTWSTDDLPAGLYFMEITAGDRREVQQITILH